jgi:hypothetical protein
MSWPRGLLGEGGVRPFPTHRYINVASESESDTMTPESVAIQVITENPELTRQYSKGDLAVLSLLQAKALELSAGRVSEAALRETLMRKLGASV